MLDIRAFVIPHEVPSLRKKATPLTSAHANATAEFFFSVVTLSISIDIAISGRQILITCQLATDIYRQEQIFTCEQVARFVMNFSLPRTGGPHTRPPASVTLGFKPSLQMWQHRAVRAKWACMANPGFFSFLRLLRGERTPTGPPRHQQAAGVINVVFCGDRSGVSARKTPRPWRLIRGECCEIDEANVHIGRRRPDYLLSTD